MEKFCESCAFFTKEGISMTTIEIVIHVLCLIARVISAGGIID